MLVLFGTSPNPVGDFPAKCLQKPPKKNNYNVKTSWAKASLSIRVYVSNWDDEKRLPAVRLKTNSIRTRSYITWPGK